MKIALLADLHLDTPFAWAGPVAGDRWRSALRETLIKAVEVAQEERVDAMFLAGDIYEHDTCSPDTAKFLASTLAEFGSTPVLVAPGNHDYLCPESIWVQAEWTDNVHVFGREGFEAFPLEEGLTVWGVAHGVPAGTRNLLTNFHVRGGGVHVGLFHGSLASGFPWNGTSELHFPFASSDVETAGLAHAFCGHYHLPRHDVLVTYPGNPNPLTFGETGERGMVVAEISSSGAVSATCRPVAVQRMHDLVLDVTGASNWTEVQRRQAELLYGRRGAARVTVSGELGRDVECDLRSLMANSTQLDALVVRRGDLHPAYNLEALQQEQTVRGQFVVDVLTDTSLTDEDRVAVLTTGLRALDGRDDLEVPW